MQTNKIVAMAQDSELPEEAEIGSHQTMSELFAEQGLDEDLLDNEIDQGDPEMDPEAAVDEMTDIDITEPDQ